MDFNEMNHIDIEVLRRYYQNELSAAERNALEQKALDDPFLKEAMEGFDENPGSFDAFYRKHSDKLKLKRGRFTFVIAVSILALFFVVTTLLKQQETLPDENSEIAQLDTVKTFIDEPVEESTEYEVIREELETLNVIPPTEVISVEEIIEHQEKVVENQKNQTENNIILIDTTDVIDEEEFGYEDETWHRKGQNSAPTVYIYNMSVVDYRQIRRDRNEIGYKRYDLGGVPANVENNEDEDPTNLVEQEVAVPYYIYLKKSMYFFAKSSFKKSLNRYKTILEQYPEDLNALFYGGLAYYNLGKYENSISYFDQIFDSEYNTFSEEAYWYKAKSLIKLDRTKEATEVLNNIIAGGGFYTQDAITLKEKL